MKSNYSAKGDGQAIGRPSVFGAKNRRLILLAVMVVAVLGALIFGRFVLAQGSFGLENAQGIGLGTTDLKVLIVNIIRIILGFLGLVAVALIIYAGFVLMTASGDPNKVEKGRKIIVAAIIGLIIILSAFVMASFVIRTFGCVGDECGGTESCSPPGATSACGLNGCGTKSCSENGFWSSCDTSACGEICLDCVSQFTYISGLKSDSLSWDEQLGPQYNGQLKVPAVNDLLVAGWAKNKGGTLNALDLLADEGAGFNAAAAFGNVPLDQEVVDNVFAAWNTANYQISKEILLKTKATPPAPTQSFESRPLKTAIKPLHCFNNKQDANEGETDVDCGGDPSVLGGNYCGACPGEKCDSDASTSVCEPNENKCRWDCANDSCICVGPPIITYVSPARDPAGDTDFSYPTTWLDDEPNGAPKNFITIWGRFFGQTAGQVTFLGDENNPNDDRVAPFPATINADCAATWQNNQIIVVVPEGAVSGPIEVVSSYGLVDRTNRYLGPAIKNFEINGVRRPGICKISNLTSPAKGSSGIYPEAVGISGNNFPVSGTQNVFWHLRILDRNSNRWTTDNLNSAAANSWSALAVKDIAPENKRGNSSIRVYNGSEYSNYFKFLLSAGGIGDPCGDADEGTCSAASVCQTGLKCDFEQACTCQPSVSVCGNGTQEAPEDCDGLDFGPAGKLCHAYGLGDGEVSCLTDCHLDFTRCSLYPFLAQPATQSIFAWAFGTNSDTRFGEPYVIEDCSRSSRCDREDTFPSPTPWSDGWLSDHPGVTHEKACLNAVISARFSVRMDPSSLSGANIRVLKRGPGVGVWNEVYGRIEVKSDSSSQQWVNDYFVFYPAAGLDSAATYKVVLRQGLRSYLNLPLKIESEKIEERQCNVAGITDAAYCWNFETRNRREPDDGPAVCSVGCVTCSPDRSYTRWPLAQKSYFDAPDSEDNVCLMLNSYDYDWQWREKEYSGGWTVPAQNPKSWVTTLNTKNGIVQEFVFPDYGIGGPVATTTAFRETYRSDDGHEQFKDTDHVRIEGTETTSGKSGYCRTHNDFTNPIVMEESDCLLGTTQSPTPWILSTNACRNALISARFSRDMVDTSLTFETDNTGSIIIEKCPSFNATTTMCNGSWEKVDLSEYEPQIKVFQYSHQVSYQDLVAGQELFGEESQALADGFVIDIRKGVSEAKKIVDTYLAANTWYRVVIMGGESGVRGAKVVDGQETPEGVLVTPDFDWRYSNGEPSGQQDYYWLFKTGANVCEVERVEVAPAQRFMQFTNESQKYDALPEAANCNILARCLMDWDWYSLISLGDARTSNTGNIIAKIMDWQWDCGEADSGTRHSPYQTVEGQGEGETNIEAVTDVSEAKPEGQGDYGHLQIGFGDLEVTSYSPISTSCVNEAPVDIGFNLDIKKETVNFNENIRLYKCAADDADCALSRAVPVELAGVDLSSQFAKKIKAILKTPGSRLVEGGQYRVVVAGGINGVKAWNGKPLTSLNYKSAVGGSEECEPGLYPWNTQDGICSSQCLLVKDKDLCGTRFAECAKADADYCDDTCHNKGNANKASCGDRIVGENEECDDGNINNNDGCSGRCLLEGSSDRWGSLCGNGRIEKGEGCDDGNANSGDGCDNQCLVQNDWQCKGTPSVCKPEAGATRPAGSSPNVPICGNGKVEVGEDCDDGNTDSKDGCSDICLNEGSRSPVCGNGFVETGQADSFSWVFEVAGDATICEDGWVYISPCPNGIWRIEAAESVAKVKVRIYRGNDATDNPDAASCQAANASQSFWQKAVNQIKTVVKRLLGKEVTAVNWWCKIYDNQGLNLPENTYHSDAAFSGGESGDLEIIGYRQYQDNRNNFVLNYIRNNYWGATSAGYNKLYKLETEFLAADGTVSQTISEQVEIKADVCLIDDVKVDIWPLGETRNYDNYFCSGDDCGRHSGDLYLKDQNYSAAGNQHLYRAWATSGERKYVVNPDLARPGFTWQLNLFVPHQLRNAFKADPADSDQNPETQSVEETSYSGDQWVTLKAIDPAVLDLGGSAVLNVGADGGRAGAAAKDVAISVFLCDRPWPAPAYFPWRDSDSNCNVSGYASCLDTNFKIYYCRDREGKSVLSDLPALNFRAEAVDNSDQAVIKGWDGQGEFLKEFFFGYSKVTDLAGWNAGSSRRVGFIPAGKYGRGAQFNNASASYIDLGDDPSLDFGRNSFAIAFWAKNISNETNSMIILGKGNMDNSASGYRIFSRRDGLWYLRLSDGTTAVNSASLDLKNKNDWTHVAFVVDRSAKKIRAYLGGNLIGEERAIPDILNSLNTEHSLALGRNSDCAGCRGSAAPNVSNYLTGSLDEVKIFNRALTAAEVKADQEKGFYEDLISYYPFEENNNAIGIRVVNNKNHYSPLTWYRRYFDSAKQGNPQALMVDGYGAVKEGRTTYVGAADIGGGNAIYTDAYLISYTEGADQETQEVYNRMTKYWRFNDGTAANGGLPNKSGCSIVSDVSCAGPDDFSTCASQEIFNACVRDESRNNYYCGVNCLNDRDCQKENLGYCYSDKSKLTRDVKRLGDLQDINLLIAGAEPKLTAGTYISGRSFSVWPSWQATLGNALSSALPVDPVNKFVGCESPYDAATCWDEAQKKMACPDNAWVYGYSGGQVFAQAEYDQDGSNYQPAWTAINTDNPFAAFLTIGVNGLCRLVMTCGDNFCDTATENCQNCWHDCGCVAGRTTCQNASGSWTCRTPANPNDWDTDGAPNSADACPWDSHRKTAADKGQCGCGGDWDAAQNKEPDVDNDRHSDCVDACPDNASKWDRNNLGKCGCDFTFAEESADADNDGRPDVCDYAVCGDGKKEGTEQCDDGDTFSGDGCSASCRIEHGCGNGIVGNFIGDESEVCDDGNTYSSDGCYRCRVETGWQCESTADTNGDGLAGPSVCLEACGDGQVVGNEICDDGAENGQVNKCNSTCTGLTGSICGNGILEGVEQCDCGANDGDPSNPQNICYSTGNLVRNINRNSPNLPPEIANYYNATAPESVEFCFNDCLAGSAVSQYCGNGVTDTAQGEECDDGNTNYGDGCNGDCKYSCPDNGQNYTTGQLTFAGGVKSQTFTASGQTAVLTKSHACRVAEKISAQVEVSSAIGQMAVVFVSDQSGSMNCGDLKTALTGAVNNVFTQIPWAKIGLVSFYGDDNATIDSNCGGSHLCDASNKAVLDRDIINDYQCRGGNGTRIHRGLNVATEILRGESAANKIIILMSDGAPQADYEGIITDTNNMAQTAKSAGIKIYAAALTDKTSERAALNYWSSNNGDGNAPVQAPAAKAFCRGVGCSSTCGGIFCNLNYYGLNEGYSGNGCDHQFCFSSNDLGNLYNGVINSLRSTFIKGMTIKLNGVVADCPNCANVLPDATNPATPKTYGVELNLPADFCSTQNPVLEIDFTGQGTVTLKGQDAARGPEYNYCAPLDRGTAAGAFEEKPGVKFINNILNKLKLLFLSVVNHWQKQN